MAEFQNPFFTSSSNDVEDEYTRGVKALQAGDCNSASRHFSNAAQGGHVSAFYNLSLLWGAGSVTPYDFDLAADCWYKAAEAGHPRAKANLWLLEAADRGGFGGDNLAKFAAEAKAGDNLIYSIMICAARFYDVICRKYGATVDVIAHELDAAARSEFDFVHSFITRTGIDKDFYAGGISRLKPNSAADQIIDGLNKLVTAMKSGGASDPLVMMARCSIVGFIIAKSPYGEDSQPLRGIDTFFSDSRGLSADDKGDYATGRRLFEEGMHHAVNYECNKAIDCYTQSIAISPNPAPYINRANILTKRLRYHEALADLLAAQRLDNIQGNEFAEQLSPRIVQAEFVSQNYYNGIREKLIADLKQNDSRVIASKIFCASFGIDYIQWEYVTFNRDLAEYHFFNDLDDIIKFDDISLYPEVEEYTSLYTSDFIEMKLKKRPDHQAYAKAVTSLHSFLCTYDVEDMRNLRRSMLFDIHEKLLIMDFGAFYNTRSSKCTGVIREAEGTNNEH